MRVTNDRKFRQEELFAGLKITEEAAFCKKYMGQVPVVSVSFKDVTGPDYETARLKMADCLARLSRNFDFLRTSPELDDFSRRRLEQCFSESTLAEDNVALVNTLEVLVDSVSEHYDRGVVLIIDDYDVPLASAAQGDYYKAMAGLLESMFGVVLKPGLGARCSLHKAFLTGTHRFSEESFNNCCINGLLSDWPMLNQAFGLTEAETAEVLRVAGLSARADDVRQWYGGFRCGSQDLYRPADVMRLAVETQSGNVPPAGDLPNYLSREALPSVVVRKLSTIGWEDQETMTVLANDQPAWVHLEDSVYGNDLATKYGASLWTLLVQTGLLSVAARREGRVWRFEYEVRFSNHAAKAVLDDCFVRPFINDIPEDFLVEVCGS